MELTKQRFRNAVKGVACWSGKEAFERFEELRGPVSEGEWKEFEFLLETARHFGALVLFGHSADPKKDDLHFHVVDPVGGYASDVTGLYRPLDNWVEVVLCRLNRWSDVENVFRHELVHLLQHATATPETVFSNLVTDHLDYGAELAAEFRANPFEGDAQEAEAYGVYKETKFLRAWVVELKRHPERTEKWTCPRRPEDYKPETTQG